MKERGEQHHNPAEREPYWQEDVAIGEGHFHEEPFTIRLRLHTVAEMYRDREELVRLRHRTGQRIYMHARPYILVPEITLTLGLYDKPSDTGAAGEVLDSQWEGMRHQEIGNAQAWHYPGEHMAVLWECFLNDHWRKDDPTADDNLKVLWTGFEQILVARFRAVERIVTTSWEDIYEETLWQDFLKQQGYQPFNKQAFIRELAKPPVDNI